MVAALRADAQNSQVFSARTESFDSYWQGTRNLEQGFRDFKVYYRRNYLPHLPTDRDARILVVSCGPGYLVNTLVDSGYRNVVGIDADPDKIQHATARRLPCEVASAFDYLQHRANYFDCIVPEQELDHLTIEETIEFLQLCHAALKPHGKLLVYAINGANPLVAPEHISHNIDHFYNVTERSLTQLLTLGRFVDVKPFASQLYVFWTRPLNYVGWTLTTLMEAGIRVLFRLHDCESRILSKRIAAEATPMTDFP